VKGVRDLSEQSALLSATVARGARGRIGDG
jgi:hypothetical protein